MHFRRHVVRAVTGGLAVALAGCGSLVNSPDPNVGQPRLEGSLARGERVTVTTEVTNEGVDGRIAVTADVLDENGTVIDSHEQTVEIDGDERRQIEFEFIAPPGAASVTVEGSTT